MFTYYLQLGLRSLRRNVVLTVLVELSMTETVVPLLFGT